MQDVVIGDALSPDVQTEGGWAGIIIDLFCQDDIPEQLTWVRGPWHAASLRPDRPGSRRAAPACRDTPSWVSAHLETCGLATACQSGLCCRWRPGSRSRPGWPQAGAFAATLAALPAGTGPSTPCEQPLARVRRLCSTLADRCPRRPASPARAQLSAAAGRRLCLGGVRRAQPGVVWQPGGHERPLWAARGDLRLPPGAAAPGASTLHAGLGAGPVLSCLECAGLA